MLDWLRTIRTAFVRASRRSSVLPNTCRCKICGASADHFGELDLSVNAFDVPVPNADMPIHYFRCGDCGFLFSPSMDQWTDEDFRTRIYTDDYGVFDPGFAELRPRISADLIDRLFGNSKASLRIVDYGGGNSATVRYLKDRGFAHAQCFDPFLAAPSEHATNRMADIGPTHLVFCCEVIEHTVDPRKAFSDMVDILDEEGLIFLTTSLQPADILSTRFGWRYICPRNGHISLFSRESLTRLARHHGLQLAWFNDEQHFAYRTIPTFARHLFANATSGQLLQPE